MEKSYGEEQYGRSAVSGVRGSNESSPPLPRRDARFVRLDLKWASSHPQREQRGGGKHQQAVDRRSDRHFGAT